MWPDSYNFCWSSGLHSPQDPADYKVRSSADYKVRSPADDKVRSPADPLRELKSCGFFCGYQNIVYILYIILYYNILYYNTGNYYGRILRIAKCAGSCGLQNPQDHADYKVRSPGDHKVCSPADYKVCSPADYKVRTPVDYKICSPANYKLRSPIIYNIIILQYIIILEYIRILEYVIIYYNKGNYSGKVGPIRQGF